MKLMELFLQQFATIMLVIGMLVAITNIIVEVFKGIFKKLPTNILVLVVGVFLTMIAFFAWLNYSGICLVWYYIFAALIVGIMVAYAAMFGFDKLKQIFESVKNQTYNDKIE